MIVRKDDNDIKLVQSVASASNLISSLTGEIIEYVKSKFPKDFFKSEFIDTAEAVQLQNRNDRYDRFLNKNQLPNLSVSPEISMDDPIDGMGKSLHLSSPNVYVVRNPRQSYKPLLIDPFNKWSIYYTCDYITVNYNFKITVNKYIQNMNIGYYLRSTIQNNMFQYLNNIPLNTEIPKTFIKLMADKLGYDLTTEDGMKNMEYYLISLSKQIDYIKHKKDMSTGKEAFFINEYNNVLHMIRDLDMPNSLIRESQGEGEYTITFVVQASTYLPNNFIMSIDPKVAKELELTEYKSDPSEFYTTNIIADIEKDEIIKFDTSDGSEIIGQNIFSSVFTTTRDSLIKSIDLKEFLAKDLLKVVDFINYKEFLVSDILKITARGREQDSIDYNVDYKNLILYIEKNKHQSDIFVNVYLNRPIFEGIKKMAYDVEYFNDESRGLTFIRIDDGTNTAIRLYELKDINDTSISKSLRVKYRENAMGKNKDVIGYIGLVDEKDPLASDYKVCLGFDNENNPIIKHLELVE